MGHRALLAYRRTADDDDSTDNDDSTDDETVADDETIANDECDADDERSVTETEPESDSTDARYDLHRSHWGGDDFALLDYISAESPYAAETHFAVDPEPVATDLSLAEIVANHLDFLHHEAFYRVSPDYETTAFHVLWFGLEADSETVERSETVGHGALVEACEDANYLRGWFRGTKAVVGDVLDENGPNSGSPNCPPDDASEYLTERVKLWTDTREVILPD